MGRHKKAYDTYAISQLRAKGWGCLRISRELGIGRSMVTKLIREIEDRQLGDRPPFVPLATAIQQRISSLDDNIQSLTAQISRAKERKQLFQSMLELETYSTTYKSRHTAERQK